jgi:hypothetical protein
MRFRPVLTVVWLFLVGGGLIACAKEEAKAPEAPASPAAAVEGMPELAAPALLDSLTLEPGDSKAVELRYQSQETGRHKVLLHQQSVQEREGKKLRLGTNQTFVLERKLVEKAGEEWVTGLRIRDLRVEPDKESSQKAAADALAAIQEALQSVTILTRLNGLGKVLSVELSGGDANRWPGLKQILEQLVKDSVVELPEKAVAPGESWKTERESLLQTRKTANRIVYDLNSTFLGYAAVAGCARCAVVRTQGTFSIAGSVTAPDTRGSTGGGGRTDSVVVLDLDEGRLVRSETVTSTRQTFALEGKEAKIPFAEEQQNRISLEWLDGTGEKAATPPPAAAQGNGE